MHKHNSHRNNNKHQQRCLQLLKRDIYWRSWWIPRLWLCSKIINNHMHSFGIIYSNVWNWNFRNSRKVHDSATKSMCRQNKNYFIQISCFKLMSFRPIFFRYENLKGKYFEIKRAQMNGEQRPYWLYYNEMDYIISHFPGHRPRINLETTNSVSATSTPNSANVSSDSTNNANVTNNSDFGDIKPIRAASLSAVNTDTSKFNYIQFVLKTVFIFIYSLLNGKYSKAVSIISVKMKWTKFSQLILVQLSILIMV